MGKNEELIDELVKCGMIDSIEAANQLLNEMELKKKENKVRECFGSIPKSPNYKGGTAYRKILKRNGNRKEITSESYQGLIEKLYQYCTETLDNSFQAVFQRALKLKQETVILSSNTIYSDESSYRRFITDDFSKLDITKIDKKTLQKYTKQIVESKQLNEKAFLKYKGVLNLAFNYAVEEDIIQKNPAYCIKKQDYQKEILTKKVKSESKIFTNQEIALIREKIYDRMNQKRFHGFYTIGYGILLSILTGMRVGEICALKWADVSFNKEEIYIHEQQLKEMKEKGGRIYYEVSWTKNEKGITQGGRKFPIYQELKELLYEIRDKQQQLNIHTKYVVSNMQGESIKTDNYVCVLQRLCKSLEFNVTNNHAFRMTLNSLVLIPAGFTVTERAAMLGHSVETNLKYYSFDPRDSVQDKINRMNKYLLVPPSPTPNVIEFSKKKKA